MKFNKDQEQNYVTVIGTIKELDLVEGQNLNGHPHIRGSVMVEAGESVFKVDLYENKSWGINSDNPRPNPKYTALQAMVEGQAVNFSCNLQENKFKGNDGRVVSTQRLNLSFINDVRKQDEPGLTFDIVGVVVKPLYEVRDREDNLKHYSIQLGQAQYRVENGYSIVTLDVPAENTNAVNFMRTNYAMNTTVRVAGYGKATVETRREEVPSEFGEPVIREFQTHTMNYFVNTGLYVSDLAKYSDEQIAFLTKATKDHNESLLAEQPRKAQTNAATGAAKGGVSSLLGLDS